MKSYRVPLVLVVILLAILGAFLHPLAMLLGALPVDTAPLVDRLERLREGIADLLGWGLLALLAVMAIYIVTGRRRQRSAIRGSDHPTSGPNGASRQAPRLVVAITAFNDATATAQAVKEFRQQPGVAQVLVVDNNSTDDTAALATAAGAKVIAEPRQGYGFACIRGLTEAIKVPDADVVVLTEGDGTFLAEDTAKLLAYINDADLVVGNRVVRGMVDSDSQMDYFFTWGNMAVAMLLRLRFWDGRHLGPAGLMDVGCTFRAIRRPALERILPDLAVGGNHFSPHMLMVSIARGLSVIEIPIRFRRRVGVSKGASQSLWRGFQVGLAMIWHIITFRLPAGGPSQAPTSDQSHAAESAQAGALR